MISITLPDGRKKEYAAGLTLKEVARDISPRLAKEALAAKVNGRLVDLGTTVSEDAGVEIITFDSEEGRQVFRHSTAHLMAQAVMHLFPGTLLAIGPAINDGFYYDFDPTRPFTQEDLAAIKKEMERLVAKNEPFEREEMAREEARRRFAGQAYKLELIDNLPSDATISVYRQGDFEDLCSGPHVPLTGYLGAFDLTSIAGAYWRGDEKNKMLQRIYGTSYPKKAQLEDHLRRIEEARRRDHRRIGQQMELFSIQDEGPGFPFFLPRGMILWNELEQFWRTEHLQNGYQQIRTPVILSRTLWERSGHWDHYRENMYFTRIDEADYAIKPMNCPGAILVYKNSLHSYRELPLRYCELGLVHRHEKSGVLHGLARVRCFTQDDSHIFALPGQVRDEIGGVIDMIDRFYSVFGLKYRVELSTRPQDAMGSLEVWEMATSTLRQALDDKNISYQINEGDGAFYGPKIDFHLEDCLGRSWQCSTIQLDFLMPELFDLTYIGEDGMKHRPVMIHRVIFGAMERFMAILIEHFGGAFPAWLAPVQVRILPITDRQRDYAASVHEFLAGRGIRSELDERNEKVGYKIREAQNLHIPYMLITGDKEVDGALVSVRHRTLGDLGPMTREEFWHRLAGEIKNKKKN